MNCYCDDLMEVNGIECEECRIYYNSIEREIEREMENQMSYNLPDGVTVDMIDAVDDYLNDYYHPMPEEGCPECGAETPDDRECPSCLAALEYLTARIKKKERKQQRETEEDCPF